MPSQGEKTPGEDVDGGKAIRTIAEMKMTVQSLQNDPMGALQHLREALEGHDAEHNNDMEKVGQALRDGFRRQYDEGIRNKLREKIRAAIEDQVKVQVSGQIKEHISVSLAQQAEETKKQLYEVKISLQNSESRTTNSALQTTDLYEPLAVVLTPEGLKSKHYPADLCSLFAYDLGTAQALMKDYGLPESEQLYVNFQRFLAHIGTHIELFLPSR